MVLFITATVKASNPTYLILIQLHLYHILLQGQLPQISKEVIHKREAKCAEQM
jgi:hypothetical protein